MMLSALRQVTCLTQKVTTRLLHTAVRSSNNTLLQKATCSTAIKQDNLLPRLSAIINQYYTQKRYYTIGDYDNLWKAATSGRGVGRGRKKKRPKDVDGDFLKFGNADMKWPGFNEPISFDNEGRRDNRQYDTGPDRKGRPERGPRLQTARERGWSGTTWPGRHAGCPQMANGDDLSDFDSIVIEVKKVSVTKALGKKRRTSALVCVGNKNGMIGWAIGKGASAPSAIRKARNKAVNYLHYIPICDGHTIYHNLSTKIKSTEIKFERKPQGHGVRSQRIIRAIAELAGIKDLRCKVVGRTTPLTVVRTAFQGLEMQETHHELAERTGKLLVEFREENGNRPTIVARPSDSAIKARLREESEQSEVDIATYFDPTKGLHRAKTVEEIGARLETMRR